MQHGSESRQRRTSLDRAAPGWRGRSFPDGRRCGPDSCARAARAPRQALKARTICRMSARWCPTRSPSQVRQIGPCVGGDSAIERASRRDHGDELDDRSSACEASRASTQIVVDERVRSRTDREDVSPASRIGDRAHRCVVTRHSGIGKHSHVQHASRTERGSALSRIRHGAPRARASRAAPRNGPGRAAASMAAPTPFDHLWTPRLVSSFASSSPSPSRSSLSKLRRILRLSALRGTVPPFSFASFAR